MSPRRSVPGRPLLLASAITMALAAGCGGASAAFVAQETSPFTAEHATVFDDGVDYVSRPDALDGDWREQWDEDLQKRVGFADLVAVVSVDTVRTDTNLERRTTYRVVCSVQSVLHGEAPPDGLTLVVRETDAGFASVHGNDARILNQGFVAFVKWYETSEDGPVAAHWHLSPASEPILEATRSILERRRASTTSTPQRRVIEITH